MLDSSVAYRDQWIPLSSDSVIVEVSLFSFNLYEELQNVLEINAGQNTVQKYI